MVCVLAAMLAVNGDVVHSAVTWTDERYSYSASYWAKSRPAGGGDSSLQLSIEWRDSGKPVSSVEQTESSEDLAFACLGAKFFPDEEGAQFAAVFEMENRHAIRIYLLDEVDGIKPLFTGGSYKAGGGIRFIPGPQPQIWTLNDERTPQEIEHKYVWTAWQFHSETEAYVRGKTKSFGSDIDAALDWKSEWDAVKVLKG